LRKEGVDTNRGFLKNVDWAAVRGFYGSSGSIYVTAKHFGLSAITVYHHVRDLCPKRRELYASSEFVDKYGYVLTTVGGVLRRKHVHLYEAEIGRRLTTTEVVHHIDGDKKNNLLSNLFLYPSQRAHQKAHLSLQSAARRWYLENGLYPERPGRKFWGLMHEAGFVLLRLGAICFKKGRYDLTRKRLHSKM
jgi:hypothetical protein